MSYASASTRIRLIGGCLVVILILLGAAPSPLHAITWCHDYTMYRVSGGQDFNRRDPKDLRTLLKDQQYDPVAVRHADSPGLDDGLLPGDVIIVGEKHSGFVNDRGLIDHYVQTAGASGQPIAAGQVTSQPNFRAGWTLSQIFNYSSELLVYDPQDPDKVLSRRLHHPYAKDRVEVWRKGQKAASASPAPAASPSSVEWVIYATQPGWLRIGTRAEFNAPWKMKDEIWGGNSESSLAKTLLEEKFASAEDALAHLCSHLTRVRVSYDATATPREIVRGTFKDREYNLRLTFGNDPEAVLHKGQEYDFATEKRVLAAHGLTPRMGFKRLWLIHAAGHSTTSGPVKDDLWMTFSAEPRSDGVFVIPDGYGGTFNYTSDRWEGPYRDNFGLAAAMKRLNVAEVDLWPPGQSYVRKVVAAEVAPQPRDHGTEVLGLQPIVDPDELQDWVVYVTNGTWLHIGTRVEFNTPVKASQTTWAGPGDGLVPKTDLSDGRRFRAYEEALDFVCRQLTGARVAFYPSNQPREVVEATFKGKAYSLHLSRDPYTLVSAYGGYSTGAEIEILRARGIAAPKKFGKQWLVHATGHGTYSGNVKDDLWMMVGSEPRNGGVTIPDGMGGTYGYSVDIVEGPFEESGALAKALKRRNLKNIGLVAEDRSVSVDDDITVNPPVAGPTPKVISISPNGGAPGDTFYVTAVAVGMKDWFRVRFGPGVTVSHETCLGKNPDGPGERWLMTVTIRK